MRTLRWSDGPGGGLRLRGPGGELARLALGAGIDPVDTPKPHVHPLCTPSGVVITGFAPADHRWHHGLQFAMPRVDGHNLWGGGTYLDPDRGYQMIPNQGRIIHRAWTERHDGPVARVTQELVWEGFDATSLLTETRTWRVELSDDPVALVVDFESDLHSATGAPVRLATPAQYGRPDGGYGGLFLRLAEGFRAEDLVGDPGADVHVSGARSASLVVHGRTAAGEPVTLGLASGDGDVPVPTPWLHRFEDFSAICWAEAYDNALHVPAERCLRFRHRLVVLDGHPDSDLVHALVRRAPSSPAAPAGAQGR